MESFFFTIVASIGLGVAANLVTDPIKLWLSTRTAVSKRKKISDLEKELGFLTLLYSNPQQLLIESVRQIVQGTIILFLATASGVFGTAALVVTMNAFSVNSAGFMFRFYLMFTLGGVIFGALLFLLGIRITGSYLVSLNKLTRFEAYKKEITERINHLSRSAQVQ